MDEILSQLQVEEGEIEVESVLPIRLDDITPELARVFERYWLSLNDSGAEVYRLSPLE